MTEIKLIPVSKLEYNSGQIKGLKKNPRFIKDDRYKHLVKSMKDFPDMLDLRELIVFPLRNKFITIAGNQRLRSGKENGYKNMPCKVLPASTSIAKLKRITILDNVQFGQDDWDLLKKDWDIDDLKNWGQEIPEFKKPKHVTDDQFKVPDISTIKTNIKIGDLIEIGSHRLMCGDSMKPDAVSKLMDGSKADITFHSPPYNAGSNQLGNNKKMTSSKYESHDDNNIQKWYDLVIKTTRNAIMNSHYAFVNLQQLAGNKFKFLEFQYHFKENFVDEMIWFKGQGNPALAPSVLNSRYEKIFIFKNSKYPSRAIDIVKFRGTVSNVYEGKAQNNNEYKNFHAATFPLHLPAHFINSFTNKSMLDLFGGTGTSMVAAEQLRRSCFMMELSPKYCQIIIDRMTKLFPKLVVKVNGRSYKKSAK